MRIVPCLAAALPLLLACGPGVEPVPRPLGGYQTLVANRAVEIPVGRTTALLPAGTRLVADSRIGAETVFCGSVLVLDTAERVCFARRGETCLSADATGAPACFPRGTFFEDWS